MIIAVANTKGGCGKTTVALQIALYRLLQKKEVWFIDGDRQQTATMALSLRATKDVAPLACASYTDGNLLRSQVLHQKERWDTIVLDVGGYDSSAMRAALSICDVLLVPFQPRNFDVWALSPITDLISEVQAARGNTFPAYAFLNCADPGKKSPDNVDAREALSDLPLLTLIEPQFGRRKAFANASGFGLSVKELKNKDSKAVAEVKALMNVLFGEDK